MKTDLDRELPPQTDDELTVTTDPKGDYALPPAGQHPARCCDVVYRGEHPNKFKPGVMQKKVSIHMMLDTEDDNGQPVRRNDGKRFVLSQWYTKSMNAKSNLRKALEAWRGKAFDDEVAETFNLNDLINAPALVNVIHKTNAKGDQVAVIDSITKLPRQMTVFPVKDIDYVRIKDRPRDSQNGNGNTQEHGEAYDGEGEDIDDDLPF